jgi:signal transduction histidine kinase
MNDIEILQRRLAREKQARNQAEALLEQKSLELYRANEQLKQAAQELERRVVERTQELHTTLLRLQEQTAAAEAANRAKSEFLANMSHELRTPLHSILSFAGFGVKKYATTTPDKLGYYFEMVQQSGKTLLALLNDLLDLAKLEAGKMTFDFQPANLGVLLAAVADEFSSLLSERHLAIHWQEPGGKVKVTADAGKLKQVVRNLLSNAVKFSPKGGTITLDMQHAAYLVVVSVRDQGPGIPEDELEAVFNKFVQSSRTKTGAGGTGLGLSICHEIITAHQGRIWATNNPDGGAVFSFELRLSRPTNAEPEPVVCGVESPPGIWYTMSSAPSLHTRQSAASPLSRNCLTVLQHGSTRNRWSL